MADLFPSSPRVWASSQGEGCNLLALYSAVCGERGWRSPHLAWRAMRSEDDPARQHAAGVRWPNPVAVESIQICWHKDFIPTAFRVRVFYADTTLPPPPEFAPADGALTTVPIGGRPIQGVTIEQAPGGGSEKHPGVLRIEGLAVVCSAKPDFEVKPVDAEGKVHTPAMPLATNGCSATVLDVSDASEIIVETQDPGPVREIALEMVRVAGVGHPDDLEAWISGLENVAIEGDSGAWERAVVVDRRIDAGRAGRAAGSVRIALVLGAPVQTRAVKVVLPVGRGGIVGIVAAALEPHPGDWGDTLRFSAPETMELHRVEASLDPLATRFREAGDWSIQGARRPPLEAPLCAAASVGVPGEDARVGVGPDGGIQLAPWASAPNGGSHGRCLHLRAGLRGRSGMPTRAFDPDAPGVTLEETSGPWTLRQEIFVDPGEDGTPVVQWWLEVFCQDRDAPDTLISVGAALRDMLCPLTLPWHASAGGGQLALRWPDGSAAIDTDDGWRVALPKTSGGEWLLSRKVQAQRTTRFALRLHLAPTDALGPMPRSPVEGVERLVSRVQAVTRDAVVARLPDRAWDRLLHSLLSASTLFIQAGDRTTYGIYPSVYSGNVFGLEEGYLMGAWAQWGLGDQALASFKASYLTPKHLDKGHYLHDLRNGLTLWQAHQLTQLTGKAWGDAFDPAERATLDALGQWIIDQRRLTEPRHDADGYAVLPGLLPPHRFGGDLSFATQSFTANAANLVGLEALAIATKNDALAVRAMAYRAALMDAFDAVKRDTEEGPFYPLDTGGGDSGAYYQLFASGLLFWIDVFEPDNPRGAAISAALERDSRLFFGIPRFDDWGSPNKGIDAVYALGYLLRALREGRRETFWTGLFGIAAHAMDPDVLTFREVGPIQIDGPKGHRAHLPSRRLDRSEPCLGALGGLLLLIRAALVQELPGPNGQTGPNLRLLGGIPPTWWDGPGLVLREAPTLGGPVTIEVVGATTDSLTIHTNAPDAESIEIQLPDWAVHATLADGAEVSIDANGRASLPIGTSALTISRSTP